ncbi:MAG TPA: hypothetical protein VGE10_05075 [Zeimonas sp.]
MTRTTTRNRTAGLIAAALVLMTGLVLSGLARAAAHLTDSAVFSANEAGENWNGWIWNTQAPPADAANRWNLYYSSSTDPANPVFLNSRNDASTNLSIEMTPGVHRFLVYGESVTTNLDPAQHFVLNLYFDGNQGAPDVSGLFGDACPSVCAASHANGFDLFGNSGLGGNTDAQEAGTLVYLGGGRRVELTSFTWHVDEQVDAVWPLWDDTLPYSEGSGQPDFVGEVWLRVATVPVPDSLALTAAGLVALLAAAGGVRRSRRTEGSAQR